MTSRDFCYWLQGYFEIHNANMPANMREAQGGLTNHQVDMVRKHLALVFVHEIDPSGPPQEQAKLNEIHGAAAPTIGGVGPHGQVYRC